MAAKKRLKKREIKEDQLVTYALKLSNYIQEHFTQVISGIVVLVAAIAIILFAAQSRRNTATAAENELALAMNQYQAGDRSQAGTAFANLADRYSGHSSGKVALYFLGEVYLSQFKFEEALAAYGRYLDRAGLEGQFGVAARIGQAFCHEGLGNFAEAASSLADLSEKMDQTDIRYYEVLYHAGVFYNENGDRDQALEFFRRVSDGATGELRDRAAVRVSLLE